MVVGNEFCNGHQQMCLRFWIFQAHQPAWSSVIAQLLVLFCKDYSPTELAGRIRSQNTVHIKRHEDDDEQYIDSSSVKHLKLISSGKPDAYTTGLSHNTVTTDVSRAVVPVTKMYQQLPDSQLTSTDILQQTPVDALARLIVNLLVSGSHGRLLLGLKVADQKTISVFLFRKIFGSR